METRKYCFRTTCLSCGKPVSDTAVIVVTQIPEDGGEQRAFIVHEGCQNAMIRDLPWKRRRPERHDWKTAFLTPQGDLPNLEGEKSCHRG